MKMPFGKHKGKPLSAIPIDYLEWLRSTDLREPLRACVLKEIERRRQPYINHCVIPRQLQETCREIVSKGYRILSKKAHPDAGGSHDQMVALNEAIKILKEIVR